MNRTMTTLVATALAASSCTRAPVVAAIDLTVPEADWLPADDPRLEMARAELRRVADPERPTTLDGVLPDDPLPMLFTGAGTPRALIGLRVPASETGVASRAPAADIATAFLARFARVWRANPSAIRSFERYDRAIGGTAIREVRFVQRYRGVRVEDGVLRIMVDEADRAVVSALGSFLPITDEIDVVPRVTAPDAMARAGVTDGESSLVIWSAFAAGGDETPRLAWRIETMSPDGGREHLFLDADSAEVLEARPMSHASLDREAWDLRAMDNSDYLWCAYWSEPGAWPSGVASACSSFPGCPACVSDPRACGRCACDPLSSCETSTWRYSESGGCSPDGSPPGEGACDPDTLVFWSDAATMHAYWSTAFGRDSWDGAGGTLNLRVNADGDTMASAGLTYGRDLDGDAATDVAWATLRETAGSDPDTGVPYVPGSQLTGHELGHMMQWDTHLPGSSFHLMHNSVWEHNADAQSFRYRGLGFAEGYQCTTAFGTLNHFTDFISNPDNPSAHKFIGNCQGWLLTQPLGSWLHYGVVTHSISLASYDQIWRDALTLYFPSSGTLFDWWNALNGAAAARYGPTSPEAVRTRESTDAVGNWTAYSWLAGPTMTTDRIASVGAPTAAQCAFYRQQTATTVIRYRCRTSTGWSAQANLNSATTDPAASEATATYRWEVDRYYVYVLFRGTDNRIHYRRYDPTTGAIGPAATVGTWLIVGTPSGAPVFDAAAPTVDRLMVAYHPQANPTYVFATHLGASSSLDLGGYNDTDIDPTLVAFPYPTRVYLLRSDLATSSTPRHIRYAWYSVASGWTTPYPTNDLTEMYNSDPDVLTNGIRTDTDISATVYGRTASDRRIRFVIRTLPLSGTTRELWYGTLNEASAGVLQHGGVHAVPIDPYSTTTSLNSGGLSAGVAGWPLSFFWALGSANTPNIYVRTTASD